MKIGAGFLGNHRYLGYSYSFSLGAVWELIAVMYNSAFYRILSFQNLICNNCVSNGTDSGKKKSTVSKLGHCKDKWIYKGCS